MTIKQYGIVAVLLIAAFSIGRFFSPASLQLKSSVTDNKHDNQTVTQNQDVVEVITETRKPDGTTIIEKRKEKETSTQTTHERDSQKETVTSKTIEVRPSFRIGGVYEPAIKGFQESHYQVILEKRIVSELYVGISGRSDRSFGFTLSLGF